jgi:thiol-disulfide isomerase/thioredoxin
MVLQLEVVNNEHANDFNNKKKKGTWLVLYHADWCGHCKDFMPTWQKLKSHLKSRKVNCASIEANVVEETEPNSQIMGYPTIHLLNNGTLSKKFNEKNRDLKTLLNFVGKKKKSLKKKKSKKKRKYNK